MLTSFIKNFDWKYLEKSLVDVENLLRKASAKEDIVFYAQISRNTRRVRYTVFIMK